MAKNDRGWIPDATDLDWIESLARPVPAALAAIEAAAEPLGIPIVDRDTGRVLSVLAGDRRRIVEVGTAYGYSTLWMALGQPAVNAPALDALAAGDPALAGPFDMVFIDALKPEYLHYLEALTARLTPDALVAADNVLWSGRTSGARPVQAGDANTAALRDFDAAVLADPRFTSTILPLGDGLLIATWRG
jgi:caffeoyl-CoA O-methyltransferase